MSTVAEINGNSTMGIPAGTRFGSYEIICPIGAGGMGVVYRACDVRLGRPVAIKTLPASYSSDPLRLRHFEQEARALSSINHPNIVTLYALGEPEAVYYIVMEFVEGQTLRQQMAQKRMRFRAVLNIGTQIAGALSAAHSAGILHRDIKPENVMVRPDGLVKVLDFGLAKLTQPSTQSQSIDFNTDIFNQDTLAIDDANASFPDLYVTTPNDGKQHKVLGTAPYMSPERLRGQGVDARADIFSLGVLLYELVAGVIPFRGRTHAEVIDAVLEEEPAPLSRYRADVPRDLEHIISKALRKDRDCRYQHIKDLLIDLQDVKQEREFEATLKRSGQYELITQARVKTASGESNCEIVSIESSQVSQPIAPNPASQSQRILSEFMNQKIGSQLTPVTSDEINLVLLIGLRCAVKPR